MYDILELHQKKNSRPTVCDSWYDLPEQINHFKNLQHQNRLDPKSGSGHITSIVLLWLAVVLYGAADTASRNILVLYEMIGPLHWDNTQVGCQDTSVQYAVVLVRTLVFRQGNDSGFTLNRL